VGVLALEMEGGREPSAVPVGLPLGTNEGVGWEVGDWVRVPVAEVLSRPEGVEE
jgi:hypothetical protein